MAMSADSNDQPHKLTGPGRFTRVSVQSAAGELEARLSEMGTWEVRVRREGDGIWRLGCRGDLDSGTDSESPLQPVDEAFRVGPLVIDPAARRVVYGGSQLSLAKKEFTLLHVLAAQPDRVFSKQELMKSIWGYQTDRSTCTLTTHIGRLRRKLRLAGGKDMVVNCWGVGYRLWDRTGISRETV